MSRLLLVLGFHRSGTSLIARSLKCFGAELGKAAEWTGPDNPTGFWEHKGVLAVNEQALRMLGARWDQPLNGTDLSEECRQMPELIYLRGAAEHLLRREIGQHPIFAIKDPRLCILMPFWRPIFAGLGCEASAIRVVRHPDAAAASLQRRDGMERPKALDLWLRYTQGAQDAIDPDWKSLVVDYDVMMAQPASELDRISRRLDLPFDRQEGHRFVTGFLNESLWHEPGECVLPPEVSIAWQKVRREATEP